MSQQQLHDYNHAQIGQIVTDWARAGGADINPLPLERFAAIWIERNAAAFREYWIAHNINGRMVTAR